MNRSYRLIVRQDELIAESYEALRTPLRRFIASRIGGDAEAEDMVQDVFAKILEYDRVLTPDTLAGFVYTTARNMITDWFRRHACRRSAAEYFARFAPRSTHETEEQVAVGDLRRLEEEVVAAMPRRKAHVYCLYVREGRSSEQIAQSLGLSRRTVENHIFSARTDLREALAYA